jgi:hypothetical protein
MEPTQMTESTLRIPFWFAHGMLTFYAEVAKAYWRAWGPMGQPATQVVEMWEGAQRQYLETLEDALISVRNPSTVHKDRAVPPINLLSPFGLLGFEDD